MHMPCTNTHFIKFSGSYIFGVHVVNYGTSYDCYLCTFLEWLIMLICADNTRSIFESLKYNSINGNSMSSDYIIRSQPVTTIRLKFSATYLEIYKWYCTIVLWLIYHNTNKLSISQYFLYDNCISFWHLVN